MIELGKTEFVEALNNILEDIFCKNIYKKGNDDQGNKREGDKGGKGGKDGNNKDNECEEGKDTWYFNDSIEEFISTMFDKQDGKNRTLITQSLYNLLGQNLFHKSLTGLAHDFGEEIEVGFYELGSTKNTWVLKEANKLMFGAKQKSSGSRKKDHYADTFNTLLGHRGNKLINIQKEKIMMYSI